MKLCSAPAGTGTRMCSWYEEESSKSRSSQTQQGSSMASSSSSAAPTNFPMKRDSFPLTLSYNTILLLLFLLPPVKPWTSSYLCPPSPDPLPPLALSLSPSPSLTAAAIHTGPPRNVPIPVAGQHYGTTEASNGSLAERRAIGRLFQRGGVAAMLYDHMSLYKCFV